MSETLDELRQKLAGLTPEQQAYIVKRVKREQEARRTLWECKVPNCTGRPHRTHPAPHARAAQRWPFRTNTDPHWGAIWMAGRGFGKTRACSEAVKTAVRMGYKSIGLIARTAADVRDTVVEGESGVIAVWPEWEKPVYNSSKAQVSFPEYGAIAYMLSSEKPDSIRGRQFDLLIFDEYATYYRAEEVLYNALMALRLTPRTGRAAKLGPRALFATTPRPTKAMKDLLKRDGLLVIRGRTHDNLENLAEVFKSSVIGHYEGTRTGRQELDGEMLTDVEGALLGYDLFEQDGFRVDPADMPQITRIVVAVDPAVTSTANSDATGVSVVGLGANGHAYVMGSWALKDSPGACMRFVAKLYHQWAANSVVVETNQGGQYVVDALRQVDAGIPVESVHASKGKFARAEPVALLYEQGRVHHVGSPYQFAGLEQQWASWTPDDGESPDELDAVVWALTKLMIRTDAYDEWAGVPKATRR